ncbi:hypothetical protein WR25_14746 [Diploscapter pachys]|uniref:Calx-beta domain-containing protein n=1 Tax=Diploscapter pachys TaxID=2018661 RepID=A0A2A2KC12_9BILA|nr:hypothetical protein WR25_14746 [Diploscapter pachys]
MRRSIASILLLAVAVAAQEVRRNSHNEVKLEGECSKAKPCAPGVILPIWQPQEGISIFTIVFRATVYLIAMFYLFFGVSIVADRFMAAIEVITSQKREVKMKRITGEPYTILVQVWNETVSNLTLMALGSSAPEILLSVIEIFGNNFEAGDLGPSTIVGSAAFNLFVIIGICIMVWEGFLTFIFFPFTVLTAYFADRYAGQFGQRFISGPIRSFVGSTRSPRARADSTKRDIRLENGKDDHRTSLIGDEDAVAFEEHRKEYLQIFKELREQHPDEPIEEIEKLATEKVTTRKLIGSGDITQKRLKEVIEEEIAQQPEKRKDNMIIIEFNPAHYMCLESVGEVKLKVTCDRGGADSKSTVQVHYRTIADTAQEQSDFIPKEGTITFPPGVNEREISVEIVDNDIYEDDEQFMVRLSQPRAFNQETFVQVPVRLGAASTATVLIVDDDHAGAFGFESEKFKVSESAGEFVAEVVRTRGARGEVSIPYKTVDGLAKAGKDYEHQEGVLRFKDNQTKAEIHIPIVNDTEYEKSEDFYIELSEPVWHKNIGEDISASVALLFHPMDEGIEGKPVLSLAQCKVSITEDKTFRNFIDKAMTIGGVSIMVGTSSWKQQFKEAITLEPEEEGGQITLKDKIMHYVSLPWKLLFALIPPTDYYKGWVCFFVAIFMIGLLTAVIGDVASHFGCTVGLKDSVTAVSLVAMGTSLPDTFASKTAAIQDKWADSSIGNVTGSNAVNVFLGIGIAWAIASFVHFYRGTKFV